MENHGQKRKYTGDDGPMEKRVKGEPEDTDVYSQRIKKKLQANSRTGQACDRCKERKMKCDPGQDGCHPCRLKQFRCVATDRITGHTYERGEAARLKKEVEELRTQVDAYRQHFELQNPAQYPISGSYQDYASLNGYGSNPPPNQRMSMSDERVDAESMRRHDADGPHRGPIHETLVDFVDGEIDIGAFVCPDMAETTRIPQAILPLNNSRRSSLATILGAQKPDKPQMPSRAEALQRIDHYQNVIAPYIPIVHGPTFRKQVADYYDHPTSFDEKPAEVVMIMVVLAIFAYQMAIRNPPMRQEKLAESNHLYHYSLSFYSEMLLGDSLANMQALALFLVHARNLPKPGNSWSLASMILARAVELNYHRSSTKIVLPPEQQSLLAIELRKRVFWSILGIQVTIAVKMGRPMAISPRDMDVELPLAIQDSELTELGVLSRSGNCDYWGHIFLCKKVPILMDLYNNVVRVRRPAAEYCRVVGELDGEITKWRHDWERATADQTRSGSYQIATHLIDIWYAEFRITLHHPRLCTSESAEVREKNLDICLEASRKMLRTLLSLIVEFKGADFTWHFISGYALAFGMAMHVYNKRRERPNGESLKKMRNELQSWLFVMQSADHYTRSGDHLLKFFQPLAQQCLDDAQNMVTASEDLRNDGHHGAQCQAQHADAPTRAEGQARHNNPATEPYYADNLVTNTIPTTTARPPQEQQQQQQQQHHNTYNTQPPQPCTTTTTTPTITTTTTSAHQKPPPYDSDSNPGNNAYQVTIPQSSSPNNATTSGNHNSVTFLPGQGQPSYPSYPPQSTRMYPPVAAIPSYQSTAATLASHDPDGFSTDVFSIAQAMWPTSIVQYHNGEM